MKIAMFATEMVPYIKTGGLADVLGSLPEALAPKVDQIDIFIPYSRKIRDKDLKLTKIPFETIIKIGSKKYRCSCYHLIDSQSGINIYLINNYKLFGIRSELYVKDGRDYQDNLTRFVFFCKGALETAFYLSEKRDYDIFHLHDWQTALIALYIQESKLYINKSSPLVVFTIHNLAYQGIFPKSKFNLLGIDRSYYHPDYLEYWGKINLIKAGLIFSHIITTVSETYAKEIQTDELGFGLGYLIRKKRNSLFGILNGVDYKIWNPQYDPYLPANYSISNLKGKKICKNQLQRFFQMSENSSIPICSVVSRLVWQKGMDLILEVIPQFLEEKIQFILLGTGEPSLEAKFIQLGNKFPDLTAIALSFSEQLAHQVEAGSDIFLMPSRYEPCGLSDKYSLKYGTVPIAHNTGGLADSIIDYSKNPHEGTGFLFDKYSIDKFEDAIDRALNVFQSKTEWLKLMKRGMVQDFSWKKSADLYLKLYRNQSISSDINGRFKPS